MANSENLDLKRLDEPKASTNFNHQIYYQNNFDKIDAAVGAPPSTLTTEAKTLVPAIIELESDKVDKVEGKGLSTNDYTTTEKNKLAGIPADTAAQLADIETKGWFDKGTIVGGNANTCTESGAYLLTSTSLNIPVVATMMLNTEKFGTRFFQTIRRLDNPAISWVRGGDISNIANIPWKEDLYPNAVKTENINNNAVTALKLSDDSIENRHLTDNYNYRGFLFGAENDANNLTKEGRYYLASSVLNLPKRNYFEGELVAVVLEVERYNTRIIQKARPVNYPNEIYYRFTDSNFTGKKWVLMQREEKPLYSKTLVLLGDSIVETGKQHLTLWENTGATTIKMGVGGTRMAAHVDVDYDKFSFYNIANAIKTGVWTDQITAGNNLITRFADDNTPAITAMSTQDWGAIDYLTIGFGRNDWATDVPLGTVDSTDNNTVIGALNNGLKDIMETYPEIKIYVVSPIWCTVTNPSLPDSDISQNLLGLTLRDYVIAIKEVCEKHHVPYCNLYDLSGINKYTHTNFLSDGTHPNDAGSERIGLKMGNYITSH